MAKLNSIYKCEICGNIVSVIENGAGALVCCGKEMTELKEKGVKEEGKEKHVPVVELTNQGIRVKVGSIEHPMDEKHYIELIQVTNGKDIVMGKRLKPGDKPIAEFPIKGIKDLRARALCNIHGLWKN